MRPLLPARSCLELELGELAEEAQYHPDTINSENSFQWVSCKIKMSQNLSASTASQVFISAHCCCPGAPEAECPEWQGAVAHTQKQLRGEGLTSVGHGCLVLNNSSACSFERSLMQRRKILRAHWKPCHPLFSLQCSSLRGAVSGTLARQRLGPGSGTSRMQTGSTKLAHGSTVRLTHRTFK